MPRTFTLNKTINDFNNQICRCYELLLRYASDVQESRYRIFSFVYRCFPMFPTFLRDFQMEKSAAKLKC